MTVNASVGLEDVIAAAAAELRAAGLDDARREARALAAAVLGLSREAMLAAPDHEIDPAAVDRFRLAVSRRAVREPFARIIGRREFWSLDFILSPDTLIPRPETEGVVEAVLETVPDRDAPLAILDLGTGTGCILLALLSELGRARGLGIDVAEGAIVTARANAERLGFASRATFRAGDWLDGVVGPFDVVVANPPYIAAPDCADLEPEVRDHEPPQALFAGADGCDAFRAIVPALPSVLAPGSLAVFECGAEQAGKVAELLIHAGLRETRIRTDLAGHERIVVARADGLKRALTDLKKRVGKRGIPV